MAVETTQRNREGALCNEMFMPEQSVIRPCPLSTSA